MNRRRHPSTHMWPYANLLPAAHSHKKTQPKSNPTSISFHAHSRSNWEISVIACTDKHAVAKRNEKSKSLPCRRAWDPRPCHCAESRFGNGGSELWNREIGLGGEATALRSSFWR